MVPMHSTLYLEAAMHHFDRFFMRYIFCDINLLITYEGTYVIGGMIKIFFL